MIACVFHTHKAVIPEVSSASEDQSWDESFELWQPAYVLTFCDAFGFLKDSCARQEGVISEVSSASGQTSDESFESLSDDGI